MARIYVIMEGGVCQGVCTNDPTLVDASYTVIDYDTDGADDALYRTVKRIIETGE